MPRNLDQAPFYAIMVTPAVHHTMGGVKIDPKTQVYNTKGQIIRATSPRVKSRAGFTAATVSAATPKPTS